MKRVFLILFLFSISIYSKAGYYLLFCTNADSLGNCKGKGQTFDWNGDRTKLDLVVVNKAGLGVAKLRFMIFFMQNDKEGKLYADLSLALPDDRAKYAMKKITFYKPGYYKIDVLNADGFLPLATGFVTVTDRKD